MDYIQNKDGGSHHKDALSESLLPFHGEVRLRFQAPEPSEDLFSCTKRGKALPKDQLGLLHACKSTKWTMPIRLPTQKFCILSPFCGTRLFFIPIHWFLATVQIKNDGFGCFLITLCVFQNETTDGKQSPLSYPLFWHKTISSFCSWMQNKLNYKGEESNYPAVKPSYSQQRRVDQNSPPLWTQTSVPTCHFGADMAG